MKRVCAAAAAAFLIVAPLGAETLAEAGGLVISDGAARSAGPMARTGAGYFTIANSGTGDDRLVAVRSEAAERVEIHTTLVENGVARMLEMEGGVPIPAGETVAFAQGGLHAMFLGLTEAWQDPDGVALTLVFESAGPVEIVLPRAEGPGGHGH